MVPNVKQFFNPKINFSVRSTEDSAMEKQANHVLPNMEKNTCVLAVVQNTSILQSIAQEGLQEEVCSTESSFAVDRGIY